MSTDALTSSWRWTTLKGLSGTGGSNYLDLFFRHVAGEASPWRVGVYSTVTMSDANITDWAVSLHVGGTGLGGNTDSYTVPYTGAISSAPDIGIDLTCYRSTRPAGAGQCRATAHVDVLTRGTSTVSSSDDLLVDSSSGTEFMMQSILFGNVAVLGQALSGNACCNFILDSIGAPWEMEAVTTGTILAVDAAPLSASLQTTGSETDIGINPPVDSNMALQPRSGVQFIARRGVDADVKTGVWNRLTKDAGWSELTPTWPAAGSQRRGICSIDARSNIRMHSTASGSATDRLSYDHGTTWAETPIGYRKFLGLSYQFFASVFLDQLSGDGMAAVLSHESGGDKIAVIREPKHDIKTVVANCRTSGETDCLPHPIVYRRPDGRWAVLWFVNDAPREYVSDDGGATWASDSPTEDWTAGAGAGYFTAFWQSISGRQVVAGYNFADEEVVILTRSGPGYDWTGPYLSHSLSTAVAPYVYQRPDGVWESGWLVAGSWTMYQANHPSATWSAV